VYVCVYVFMGSLSLNLSFSYFLVSILKTKSRMVIRHKNTLDDSNVRFEIFTEMNTISAVLFVV